MSTAIGGYELESELGQGATGTVYRARRADEREPVALKVLSTPRDISCPTTPARPRSSATTPAAFSS